MKFSRGGIGALAAGLVCAGVVTLVPGADAAKQPTTATPQDSTNATVSRQAAGAAKGALTRKVRGTYHNGTVRGTFDPVRFIRKNGGLYAVGTVHAVVRNAAGNLVGTQNKYVTIPVRNANATSAVAAKTCSILHLVLGPLDLNLLGLKVHLDRVVLDITATSGPGNLLGNLLCAVAGLLDGNTPLSDLLHLANILNRILTLLKL